MNKTVDILLERVRRFPKLYVSLFLLLLVGMVYGQTLRSGFVNYDDHMYVTANPVVQQGLSAQGMEWAFTHPVSLNWHPLTMMSHMLDCSLYGQNAGGHHFTNVALHGLAVVLLFLMLTELTGSVWASAFVAAVFAVHPLRAESVAWISERKDVLSGVFFMLTLMAYVRYARRPAAGRYVLVVVTLALGLMSKPMLVTIPFVLLLLDYWPLKRFDEGAAKTERIQMAGRLFMEKIPFFGLAALSCMATLLTQQGWLIQPNQLSLPVRLANMSLAYTAYIYEMFWPAKLGLLYLHPRESVSMLNSLLAWLMLVGMTVVFVLMRRKRPYLLVGWLWFLGMLIPVIGLVQVGQQSHADRYTYLPQIGLYIAVAWSAGEWLRQAGQRKVLGRLAVGVVAVLAFAGHRQASYWHDSETLWQRSLVVNPDNYVARAELGAALYSKGLTDEAMDEFQKALALKPHDSDTYDSIGAIYVKKGRPADAEDCFKKALELFPEDSEAHKNLGILYLQQERLVDAATNLRLALEESQNDAEAYNAYANVLLKKGDEAGALTNYEKAVAINSLNAGIQNNLASLYLKQGALPQAMEHFAKVVEADQAYPGALRNVALLLAKAGKLDDAAQYFEAAVKVDDQDAEAHFQLANILLNQGHFAEAAMHYQKSLMVAPHNAEAESNLALAMVQGGNVTGAIEHWEKALSIDATSAKTHNNLAGALMAIGKSQEAIAHYEKALAIQPQYTEAQAGLAWALATAPEASDRNGSKAVELAEHANATMHGASPMVLRILAAAYAEDNRFTDATNTAQHALELAGGQGNRALSDVLQKELVLYRSNTPLHSALAK